MPTPETLAGYECDEYLASPLSRTGMWDPAAQVQLILPLTQVEEMAAEGFLIVGRPGVDSIVFGYRRRRPGIWAYHPLSGEYQHLAEGLSLFLQGWADGTITV